MIWYVFILFYMKPEFQTIAAYEADDIPSAAKRIASDPTFQKVIYAFADKYLKGLMSAEQIVGAMASVSTLAELNTKITMPFLQTIERNTTKFVKGFNFENAPDSAFYITNHRNIILDSAFLSTIVYQLRGQRPYIGIGTNLFGQPWIEDFVRINRAFCVIRGGTPRELLQNAQLLSAYIKYLMDSGECIWLAQREGRAKNSDDRTQTGILKMLSLSATTGLKEHLRSLRITPVAINYEFDPCDFLKAKEMQQKRDNPEYVKTKEIDLQNMYWDLLGQKGRVCQVCTDVLDAVLDDIFLRFDNRNEQLAEVCRQIDKQIHTSYHLFPNNYVAADMLNGKTDYKDNYSETEKADFEQYIEGQIGRIDLPQKDIPFLKHRLIEMYAMPVINKYSY